VNTSLHHVGLTVSNLERAVEFYCEVLGCVPLERACNEGPEVEAVTGYAGARVNSADLRLPGGGVLELLEYTHPSGNRLVQESCDPGHSHFAFSVGNIDSTYERVLRMGGLPRSLPVRLTAPGSMWDGARIFYALDPDGRTLEFVQPP